MGVDPDKDDETEILNPNFNDDSIWVIDEGWWIGGGIAQAISTPPVNGTMRQVAGFQRYFRYRLTFDMLNCDILDPLTQGLKIEIGGTLSPLYSANGTYTYEAVASDASGELIFISFDMWPFKFFQIDNLVLEKIENYIEDELDIFVPEPKITSTFQAAETDYFTQIHSRNGDGSCLISYNV